MEDTKEHQTGWKNPTRPQIYTNNYKGWNKSQCGRGSPPPRKNTPIGCPLQMIILKNILQVTLHAHTINMYIGICVYIEIYKGLQLVKEEVTSLKGKKEKIWEDLKGGKRREYCSIQLQSQNQKANIKQNGKWV